MKRRNPWSAERGLRQSRSKNRNRLNTALWNLIRIIRQLGEKFPVMIHVLAAAAKNSNIATEDCSQIAKK